MSTAIDFKARLDPEYTVSQLDERADSAARICVTAIKAGDAAKAELALTRLVSRWEKRDGLTPAPTWLWKARHMQIDAIGQVCENDDPLLDTVWWQFYRTLLRADGIGEPEAAAYALDRTRNMNAMAADGWQEA